MCLEWYFAELERTVCTEIEKKSVLYYLRDFNGSVIYKLDFLVKTHPDFEYKSFISVSEIHLFI